MVGLTLTVVNKKHYIFQAVIERPTSRAIRMSLKREYEQLKAMREAARIDYEMPVDVQEIVALESERRKTGTMPTRSSLKQARTESEGLTRTRTLSWQESHTEIQIQSDVPAGKRLRPVS